MFLATMLIGAMAVSGTDLKVLHNDRTEQFINCTVMRDSRMSEHGGLSFVCNEPVISKPEIPRFRPSGDWSYYVTDGFQVWERDSRCGFVQSDRSEWGNYETITISCKIPLSGADGDIIGPTTDF